MASEAEKVLAGAAVTAVAVTTAAVLGPAVAGAAVVTWLGSVAAGIAKDCKTQAGDGNKS